MRNGAKAIRYEQRLIIEKEMRKGTKVVKIAEMCGLNRASVYKELKKCPPGEYKALAAQKKV